jgi:hypothetical protein
MPAALRAGFGGAAHTGTCGVYGRPYRDSRLCNDRVPSMERSQPLAEGPPRPPVEPFDIVASTGSAVVLSMRLRNQGIVRHNVKR